MSMLGCRRYLMQADCAEEHQPGEGQSREFARPGRGLRGDVAGDHAPADRQHDHREGDAGDDFLELVGQDLSAWVSVRPICTEMGDRAPPLARAGCGPG